MREAAIAVNYLHCKQPPIIHRDIKPENILLDGNLQVKLCDFGWSNFFNEEVRHTLCGTPEYLAPEMIRKSGHDTRLDLWNLGVLLFELLAGSAPFRGKTKEELYTV
jgi:serine/threonine protein kinase